MKNLKSYEVQHVKYGFQPAGRTWAFTVPPAATKDGFGRIYYHKLAGRAETAHRVAGLISKSFDRTGTLDGLTKSNINRLLATAEAKLAEV